MRQVNNWHFCLPSDSQKWLPLSSQSMSSKFIAGPILKLYLFSFLVVMVNDEFQNFYASRPLIQLLCQIKTWLHYPLHELCWSPSTSRMHLLRFYDTLFAADPFRLNASTAAGLPKTKNNFSLIFLACRTSFMILENS